MKKIFLNAVMLLMFLALALGMVACGGYGFGGELSYDKYPTDYDPNVDSWKQIDPDDEDVEITWFVNNAYTDYSADLIYKNTGVRVNFQTALTSDNTELNTMISGNKLPDIITINDLTTRVQLAEQGYVYAIDRLAESYAPSLLSRISQEQLDYYSASDGHCYGLAQNFYNDEDIRAMEEDYEQYQYPTSDVIVRRDYLEEYIAYKKSVDANFNPDTTITKPSGFIEMVKWVKEKYNLSNANPTVAFSPFLKTAQNDSFSLALTALTEMFAVPYEDKDGNYLYWYDTPEFYEVISFMNTLYKEKLVFSENFSYTREQLGTHLMNGKPVAYIGASQQLGGYLAIREKQGYNPQTDTIDPAYEYVSIVLTNEKGDAPLIMDYAGRGSNVTMITKNCKRVDRVIKVFDYMMSEQGQREMYYGETEGEYYNYVVRPGEIDPDTGKVSRYGVMEWTDKAKDLFKKDNLTTVYQLGFTRQSLLTNPLYKRLTGGKDNPIGATMVMHYIEYRNKTTYFDYGYSRVPFRYPITDNASIDDLNDYIEIQAKIEETWIEALPKLIMATDSNALKSIYDETLQETYDEGANQWTQFRNDRFKAYKEYLNIDYAWPKADPEYKAPEVKLFGSSEKYYKERPEWISYDGN